MTVQVLLPGVLAALTGGAKHLDVEPQGETRRLTLPSSALDLRGLAIDEHAAVRRDGILDSVVGHRSSLRAGPKRCKRISVPRRCLLRSASPENSRRNVALRGRCRTPRP